jgi:hypothetical protein
MLVRCAHDDPAQMAQLIGEFPDLADQIVDLDFQLYLAEVEAE